MLMLRRGAPIVALVTVLLTVAAVLLAVRQEPLYEASAEVFIDTENVGTSLADVGQSSGEPQRVLDTQAKVARVPDIIRPTLEEFPTPPDPSDFLLRSSVTADANADILTFTVTDSDRQRAPQLANAYARAYTAYRRELDTGALGRAQLETEDQLQELRSANRTTSNLYEELTARNQELENREILLAEAVPLGPAQGAVQVQPHPVRNGILGGIVGLLLGVGLVFVREALNTRARTAADVETHLGIPLLGRLHEPPKDLRSRNQLAMMAAPDAAENEAFQLLTTNIEFTNLDRGAKSFMVTSANPAEGKSTTIANLAVTFARSGKRVVLVDLDLRRPVLHRFFDLDSRPGITEVALGRAWLDDALVPIPLEDTPHEEASVSEDVQQLGGTLEVLPAGPLPPNASEFVRSQALGDVLRRLEDRADVVLIDAPAMLAVSDAINLTPKVDALIVLTRIPTVRRPALQELRRILDNAPVAKVGFVLTGAREEDAFMGSYGYGYGYGSDEAREKIPSMSR
jgi:capsular exopolysaccharide synthesis family protein